MQQPRIRQSDTEERASHTLVDLRSVSIDKALSVPERMSSFIRQVKNPYLFKVDDITVNVEFSSGKSISDALLSLLMTDSSQ